MLEVFGVPAGPYNRSTVKVNALGMFVDLDRMECHLQGYPEGFVTELGNALQAFRAGQPVCCRFEGVLRGDIRHWIEDGEILGIRVFLPRQSEYEGQGVMLHEIQAEQLIKVFRDFWII